LSKNVIRNIDKFLNTIDGKKLDNEKLIYNQDIIGSRKFSKINAREFEINTNHYTQNQSQELFERLLLGLMNISHLGDSCYIEYKIKDEDEPRYQVLSPMNEDKLKIYIETYLNSGDGLLYIDGSYNFFDVIPSEIESIKIVDNNKYFDLKAYDNSENEIEYKTDRFGRIKKY
jgi:hypothetical protein